MRQPGVERDEQVERLGLAHLADHEPVRAHPQSLLDQAPQGDLAGTLEARLAALHRDPVGARDRQFEGLLNGDDALVGPCRREQRTEQGGLARLSGA
jgi:hypothetical protein